MFPRSWGILLVVRSLVFSLTLNPSKILKMSPAVAHAGAGAAAKDKKESATARLLGSGKKQNMTPKDG
jgi:hypothetical protein